MQTVHLDSGREWRGGQRQVLLLSSGLTARGHTATLVCPVGAPLAARARAAGLEVLEIAWRGAWDVLAARRVRELVRKRRPEIVHAHTAHAVTTMGLATAGLGAARPRRVAARRVDFRPSRPGMLGMRWMADAVIAVSRGVARVLLERGLDPSHVAVVESGIDLAAATRDARPDEARSSLGLGPDARVIGNVAQLVDHKDHLTLIRAARTVCDRVESARFVIAGSGPLRSRLAGEIARLGLEGRVLLAGHRDDLASLLGMFQLFVMSSKLEGLGSSILDAMAAGLPVVATRTGGIPEAVSEGETGLLVDPGRPDELARAILRLLDDPGLARRLGQSGLDRAAERFSEAAMVERTLAVYRGLLAA